MRIFTRWHVLCFIEYIYIEILNVIYGEVKVMLQNSYLKDMTEGIIESENKDERRELLYQLLKDLNDAIKSVESDADCGDPQIPSENAY